MIFFVFLIKDLKKVEDDLYVDINVFVKDEEWLYMDIIDFVFEI